jgi:CRISPR-associated endoribonuclease Cas6
MYLNVSMQGKSITSLTFNVEAHGRFRFQRYTGFAVQNFFFKMLGNASVDLAKSLHDASTIKPYSVSTLMTIDDRPVYYGGGPGKYRFKINLLNSEQLNPLTIIQTIKDQVTMDNIRFSLNGVEVKIVSYDQLLNGELKDRFTLKFISPTCFKSEVIYPKRVRGTSNESVYEVRRKEKRAYQPIPNPNAMLRNLMRIWMKNCELPKRVELEHMIDNDHIRIYEYPRGIRTVWAREGSRKNQQGFVGEVTFEVSEKALSSVGNVIAALVKMGEYSGTGIMRTAGLGQYKIVDGVK